MNLMAMAGMDYPVMGYRTIIIRTPAPNSLLREKAVELLGVFIQRLVTPSLEDDWTAF